MKVILASNNANKLREMQQILSPLGWEILRQKDVGLHLEPDEKKWLQKGQTQMKMKQFTAREKNLSGTGTYAKKPDV